MKLNVKNWEKTNKELDKVNGQAQEHTFTGTDLMKIGKYIKRHLNNWLTLSEMQGVVGFSKSGHKLPNSYQHSRIVNRVSWIVGYGGNVFITKIEKVEGYNKAGRTVINFSDKQKEIIKTKALSKVSVLG